MNVLTSFRGAKHAKMVEIFVVWARGVLSGKVGTGMCGSDGVLFPFRNLRFTKAPFLFENWFRYRSRFCKMHNFR